MDMSDRIRICLKQQNMSMKDLSNLADIPLSTLSDLMNGKTKKLDIQKAKDISIVLRCSLDYLINADLLEDIGFELEQERESHDYTLEMLSQETKIPVEMLQKFEESTEPINLFLLSKICDTYGISVNEFKVDTEIYDEFITPYFNGDVDKYEAFKKAVDEDTLKEHNALTIPEDEIEVRAIQRAAKKMTPQDRKKMLQIIKLSFEDAFSENE